MFYIDADIIRDMLTVSQHAYGCLATLRTGAVQLVLTEPQWKLTAIWSLTAYIFMLRCAITTTYTNCVALLTLLSGQVPIRMLANSRRRWGARLWPSTKEPCRNTC